MYKPVAPSQMSNDWKRMAVYSGYATILEAKSVGTASRPGYACSLGPPNLEVDDWLHSSAIKLLVGQPQRTALAQYATDLCTGNYDALVVSVQAMLPVGDHRLTNETHFGGYTIHLLNSDVRDKFKLVVPESRAVEKTSGMTQHSWTV